MDLHVELAVGQIQGHRGREDGVELMRRLEDIYIYIYISYHISVSLSLYIYIYIHIHICTHTYTYIIMLLLLVLVAVLIVRRHLHEPHGQLRAGLGSYKKSY